MFRSGGNPLNQQPFFDRPVVNRRHPLASQLVVCLLPNRDGSFTDAVSGLSFDTGNALGGTENATLGVGQLNTGLHTFEFPFDWNDHFGNVDVAKFTFAFGAEVTSHITYKPYQIYSNGTNRGVQVNLGNHTTGKSTVGLRGRWSGGSNSSSGFDTTGPKQFALSQNNAADTALFYMERGAIAQTKTSSNWHASNDSWGGWPARLWMPADIASNFQNETFYFYAFRNDLSLEEMALLQEAPYSLVQDEWETIHSLYIPTASFSGPTIGTVTEVAQNSTTDKNIDEALTPSYDCPACDSLLILVPVICRSGSAGARARNVTFNSKAAVKLGEAWDYSNERVKFTAWMVDAPDTGNYTLGLDIGGGNSDAYCVIAVPVSGVADGALGTVVTFTGGGSTATDHVGSITTGTNNSLVLSMGMGRGADIAYSLYAGTTLAASGDSGGGAGTADLKWFVSTQEVATAATVTSGAVSDHAEYFSGINIELRAAAEEVVRCSNDVEAETDFVAGNVLTTLTLENCTWTAAGTGAIGTIAETQALIDSFDGSIVAGTGFNQLVRDPAVHTIVTRESDTVATIAWQAASTFDLTHSNGASDVVDLAVPAASTSSSSILALNTAFTIDATKVGQRLEYDTSGAGGRGSLGHHRGFYAKTLDAHFMVVDDDDETNWLIVQLKDGRAEGDSAWEYALNAAGSDRVGSASQIQCAGTTGTSNNAKVRYDHSTNILHVLVSGHSTVANHGYSEHVLNETTGEFTQAFAALGDIGIPSGNDTANMSVAADGRVIITYIDTELRVLYKASGGTTFTLSAQSIDTNAAIICVPEARNAGTAQTAIYYADNTSTPKLIREVFLDDGANAESAWTSPATAVTLPSGQSMDDHLSVQTSDIAGYDVLAFKHANDDKNYATSRAHGGSWSAAVETYDTAEASRPAVLINETDSTWSIYYRVPGTGSNANVSSITSPLASLSFGDEILELSDSVGDLTSPMTPGHPVNSASGIMLLGVDDLSIDLPWWSLRALPGDTANQTLPAITQEGTGAISPAGNASQSLPSITQEATGAESIPGTADQALPAITQEGTGAEVFTGTAGQALPAITQEGTGAEVFTGTADQALPAITQSATGDESIPGAGAQTLPAVTQSATGTESIPGSADQTLPAITQAGSAASVTDNDADGTSDQTLPAVTQAATAAESLPGAGDQSLPAITQEGTALQGALGSANQTLPSITQLATAAMQPDGAGNQTLPAITQTGQAIGGENVVEPATLGSGRNNKQQPKFEPIRFVPLPEEARNIPAPMVRHPDFMPAPMVSVSSDGREDDQADEMPLPGLQQPSPSSLAEGLSSTVDSVEKAVDIRELSPPAVMATRRDRVRSIPNTTTPDTVAGDDDELLLLLAASCCVGQRDNSARN
jgi:hypothetical protein